LCSILTPVPKLCHSTWSAPLSDLSL
jgi:hypothetical protein